MQIQVAEAPSSRSTPPISLRVDQRTLAYVNDIVLIGHPTDHYGPGSMNCYLDHPVPTVPTPRKDSRAKMPVREVGTVGTAYLRAKPVRDLSELKTWAGLIEKVTAA